MSRWQRHRFCIAFAHFHITFQMGAIRKRQWKPQVDDPRDGDEELRGRAFNLGTTRTWTSSSQSLQRHGSQQSTSKEKEKRSIQYDWNMNLMHIFLISFNASFLFPVSSFFSFACALCYFLRMVLLTIGPRPLAHAAHSLPKPCRLEGELPVGLLKL